MACQFNENTDENKTLDLVGIQTPILDHSIIKCWDALINKPVCIIFDLDYTLWPTIIDQKVLPPIKKKIIIHNNIETYEVKDHTNRNIIHYEDVPKILATLKECFSRCKTKHYLAIASKATTYDLAVQLIQMYGWLDYFNSIQIYSGTKTKHMKNIQTELKLNNYKDFLFFDDSKSNISQTETLGLTAHKVGRHYGLNVNELNNGLKKFNLKRTI